ncbi:hypothetical protein [Salinarimonas ramus]|uniref:Uncharacterized protein n=1 Tax=Salinarimonas ramus TaxID=690164 RepID=A0A917V6R4_9HYPH|nr:hypothetical protein [Salinarimonas ramus]GGK45329.1 hypothetical protein GCM10011322_35680 [Salinarimonas ramus]
MGRIRKGKPAPDAGAIRKREATVRQIKFSFALFSGDDEVVCPRSFQDGYVRTLMERLRDLSSWDVVRFTNQYDKAVRNHVIDWARTARPEGFDHLNEQYRAYPAWQFSLTSNEHGRVHGIIIDDTFFVIWLDANHALYP